MPLWNSCNAFTFAANKWENRPNQRSTFRKQVDLHAFMNIYKSTCAIRNLKTAWTEYLTKNRRKENKSPAPKLSLFWNRVMFPNVILYYTATNWWHYGNTHLHVERYTSSCYFWQMTFISTLHMKLESLKRSDFAHNMSRRKNGFLFT
jgi:hypothetical protein